MPAKQRPSDDPDERRRALEWAVEQYQGAIDQNAKDQDAGRIPMFGHGAVAVLAKRLDYARAAVAELAELAGAEPG